LSVENFAAIRAEYMPYETDKYVKAEWEPI
jgi:hypothetical protein